MKSLIFKPQIFHDKKKLPPSARIIDYFGPSLKELFFIKNPQYKKDMPEVPMLLEEFLKRQRIKEIWIYFPHLNAVIRSVPENIYYKLRTSRNRNIISEEEQFNYRKAKVGIAGLSVGSGVLLALVITGGPKILKIADFDNIEVTNLNRIKAKVTDLGMNKTHVAAREVWELDPFADLYLFDSGLTEENIEKFILNKPKLDIFVDEMDSIDLKIRARIISRCHKIPVIMATDNGDGIILDIERFDQEPRRKIFHGLVGDMNPEKLKNADFKLWLKMATKIVGPEYLTERMQDSIVEIGKKISAVPQLGTSANIAGAAVAYAIRRISNGQDMPSGRYIIGLEEKLIPNYSSLASVKQRRAKTKEFKNKFTHAR